MTTRIPELQAIWVRFRGYGVPDSDLHELVTLAQDMERARVIKAIDDTLMHPRFETIEDVPGRTGARAILESLRSVLQEGAGNEWYRRRLHAVQEPTR